ncbi:hypothetical protein ACHQM5_011981 [Ranunculus cassubicifolius]
MAAAEARVAWQRTANRYFVQEDAKRAPKLASCPSSSSSTEPPVDGGTTEAPRGQENAATGFVPLNWNSTNSNLPPNTKWWLQFQPTFGHQKDFTPEQLIALDVELESLRNDEIKKTCGVKENTCISTEKKEKPSLDLHPKVLEKNKSETLTRELMATKCDDTHKTFTCKDMGENMYKDEDTFTQLISKQPEKLFDLESPWIGGGKTEPWWRNADKDELASFVAKKSLEHIENCDLPPPQTMHGKKGHFACHGTFAQEGIFSSLSRKEPSGLCGSGDHAWGCRTCGSMNAKQSGSGEKGLSYGFEKSCSLPNDYTPYSKDSTFSGSDEPSKAQLMEALCHSQTRARKAENAAQQAYNEKEHIVKLFFRQASHLFAYKQWLQMLQLESICLQLKNKDQAMSTLFPVFLPWLPHKNKAGKKFKHKKKKVKEKEGGVGFDIGRYALAFAVGLGLAGAGLLLGWTMGWLFPMF